MRFTPMIVLVWLTLFATVLAAETTPPPNILLIVADDIGWADVGWHGGH